MNLSKKTLETYPVTELNNGGNIITKLLGPRFTRMLNTLCWTNLLVQSGFHKSQLPSELEWVDIEQSQSESFRRLGQYWLRGL